METENGVPLEDEKKIIVEKSNYEEGSTSDVNKLENMISNSHEPVSGGNEVCKKDEITEKEGPNSSGPEVILSETVPKIKTSNPGKSSDSNGPKNNKLAKNLSNSKLLVAFGRSTKSSLTQSLSFPSRGPQYSDIMKRSIEVYPTKADIRHSQKNSSKIESQISNGSLISSPRIKPACKGPFPGVSSKTGKAIRSPSLRQTVSGKHVSANGTAPDHDVLVEKTSESSNNVLLLKEDDAHSTTSSNLTPRAQQRISVSEFSFKLEKRAEKRKEFFSKIEEKVQAKEEEKNNLQAKSKEYQDAEIKQLRKSLTFKAAPMPSFYKEPPPKVELKKIPTTRAISPKLGRHKGTASPSGNSPKNGGQCVSPRVSRDNCKSPKAPQANAAFLKSGKSSLSKSSTQESTTPRKVKHAEAEGKLDKKTQGQSLGEAHDQPHCPPELEDEIEEGPEKNTSSCCNGSNLASSNPEATPAEVTVEGS